MTKIAFRAESPASLRAWLEAQGGSGEARLVTRYLPKRHAEMEGGSLYWILGGTLIGRSPLRGFAARDDGKYWIGLAPCLIPVAPRPRRAHQGWRYLEEEDAPPDMAEDAGPSLPPSMVGELAKLGLL